MKSRALTAARLIIEHDNIVAIARAWPKADSSFGGQPFLANHLVEHVLRVLKQAAGRLTDHISDQNGRITPMQIPALEKRRPINISTQFCQIIIMKDFRAGELRLQRLMPFFGRPGICPRFPDGGALVFGAATRMSFRHRLIIGADFSLIIGRFFFR